MAVARLSALMFGLALPALAEAPGDAERGARLYERQCKACHQIGPDAVNRVGPHLEGVIDRPVASVEGFRYSPAMTAMGTAGEVWTAEALDAFLANPRKAAPGTRMAYRGMTDAEARGALMAFLGAGQAPAAPSAPGLDPAILAIEGDIELGEYLASDCTSCHRLDGSDQGIPAITGWPQDDFVTAMHAYKSGQRENPVMQMMARRFDNDEIAALAAWFATLD